MYWNFSYSIFNFLNIFVESTKLAPYADAPNSTKRNQDDAITNSTAIQLYKAEEEQIRNGIFLNKI